LSTLGQSQSGYSLAQLSKELGIGKSTVHRLLATMKDEGFVMIDPITSRYTLGVSIAKLNEQLTVQFLLLKMGAPILERLAREGNETVNLATLDGRDVLYLAKQESAEPLRASGQVGRRFPAYATALGKALLSGLSQPEFRALYLNITNLKPIGPNTVRTVNELWLVVESVKREGIAFDDEEIFAGLCCIACPVRNFSGRVIAGLSLSIPKYRLTPERKVFLQRTAKECADELSRKLGYASAQSGDGRVPAAGNHSSAPRA
jgi:IclR family transcriptional regulator, KDG regulon repressor